MSEIKTSRDLINHCNKTKCTYCDKETERKCNVFFNHYKTLPMSKGYARKAWDENKTIEEL